MDSIEIIQVSKLSQSKVYVPKRVRSRLNIKDGDRIMWIINERGELIVRNSKESLPSTTIISY